MSDDGLGRVRTASMLSLPTSGSTLVCCALPALLVALGAGAALSSLVTAVPQLGAGLLQWRARGLPCPIDPALAAACTATRRLSLRLYLVSVAIYLVGAFFAFLAPMLM